MEQVIANRFSRAEKVFLFVLIALAACVVAGKHIASKKYALNYKHSLAYPKLQNQELIQVGSLDRG